MGAATPQTGDQNQSNAGAAEKDKKNTKTDAAEKSATDSSTTPKKTPSKKSTSSTPAAPTTAAPAGTLATKTASSQKASPANSAGIIWVHMGSGVYYKPGTRWSGRTKQGKYMTEADAIKAGYHAAKKE